MKIALGQIEVTPGHPRENLKKILLQIEKAKTSGVKILVFSEMVVSGYMLGDEWENKALMEELIKANETIKEASEEIVVIWGSVFVDKNKKGEDGRWRKYNSVFIAQDKNWVSNGVFVGRTYKSLMPKYREFDDERHFFSLIKEASELNIPIESALQPFEVEIENEKINLGLILCEDMWCDDYSLNPSKVLVNNGAQMIINLSCSPWTWRKNTKRHSVVKKIVDEINVPFLYCNNTGVQNNGKNIFLLDGNSSVYNSTGEVIRQAKRFEEEMLVFDTSDVRVSNTDQNIEIVNTKAEEFESIDRDVKHLYEGLVFGIKKFFEKLPNKRVVIGLSGGIDSAVVACLLTDALGSQNILAVNMPSKFNSDLTKNAAKKLAENLGIDYKIVPIQESVELTTTQLMNSGFELNSVVVENIQARDRGSRVLSAISGILGGVFVNNGNKTETALGYCTLYGDVSGAIAPIADMYKGQVYEMARYINRLAEREIILLEIINVVPSAELSAEQDVTQGKGDPIKYPYHDKLIRAFVEWRLDPAEILKLYDDGEIEKEFGLSEKIDKYFANRKDFIADLEHKWRLYKINIFKRIQAPPIIAVSKRAFGFDLREAQNGVYFTEEFTQKSPPRYRRTLEN